MLFLYRPRQTWMPYRVPRPYTQQQAYNLQLQQRFDATRRVAPYAPEVATESSSAARDPIADLEELDGLHRSGVLSDTEFSLAKAKLLGLEEDTT
jgi:hypothetical protein